MPNDYSAASVVSPNSVGGKPSLAGERVSPRGGIGPRHRLYRELRCSARPLPKWLASRILGFASTKTRLPPAAAKGYPHGCLQITPDGQCGRPLSFSH